jgi:hypothetical protein
MCAELKTDFANFSNCDSIYTNTFNSHYAIFFGDYLFKSENKNFPHQLKKLGFNVCSYCNAALFTNYPLKNVAKKEIIKNRPKRDEIINDFGLTPEFNWKKKFLGNHIGDYIGCADDEERKIPDKWYDFIINNKEDTNFLFLHFWKTHHNYGINEFLKSKIYGINYREIGRKLLKKIRNGEITEKFVKVVYANRILDVINLYIYDLIKILKTNGLYDDSLIIITADHGEGLGDIGISYPWKLSKIFDYLLKRYKKIRKKYQFLPLIRKIPNKFDLKAFFHNGEFKLQKQIPFLIKFPKNFFGGIKYNGKTSLFDIIHTIDNLIGNKLNISTNLGCSLLYLLMEGESAREKYKLSRKIENLVSLRELK